MSRRRKRKNAKKALLVMGAIFAALVISGLGITIYNFLAWGIIIAVLVLGIAVFILIWNLPANKGKRGEKKVGRILEDLAQKHSGYVINDVIIPNNNGGTSQIDHVLISPYGIVVVETKNYSGRLYGTAKQQYWTQVLAYGNTKNKMYNPLLQNETHIYNLEELLGDDFDYYSYVVILRADMEYLEAADEVFTPRELKQTLNVVLKKTKFNEEQVEEAFNKLNEFKLNPIATSKEHVRNIKQTQKAIQNNICPRCGGELVLRKSQSGYEFYGCSNYPKCKFTKKNF